MHSDLDIVKKTLSDGNEYSFMQIRKETDTDAGVGKSIVVAHEN